MSDEPDSWFQDALGVDSGAAAKRFQDSKTGRAKQSKDRFRHLLELKTSRATFPSVPVDAPVSGYLIGGIPAQGAGRGLLLRQGQRALMLRLTHATQCIAL